MSSRSSTEWGSTMTSAEINVTAKWIEDYIHFDIEESTKTSETIIYIRCEYCETRFGEFPPGLYRPSDYITKAVLHYSKHHPTRMRTT